MTKPKYPRVKCSGGCINIGGKTVMTQIGFQKTVGRSRPIEPIIWTCFISQLGGYKKEFSLLPADEMIKYVIEKYNDYEKRVVYLRQALDRD